ncbi:MAG: DUF541 domain-containing protein [Geminicoccaceae bacterium]|nr:MAG: DUF541 domain-containing protein [Geminicoccaceae bacterium]
MTMRVLAWVVAAGLVSLPAMASEPLVTRLALSETASVEVVDDRFVAVLAGQAEDTEARAAQAALNALMRQALDTVGAAEGLRITTEGYRVFGRERDDQPTLWVARQALRLETADREALLDHVASLQALGLMVQQLGSELSQEARDGARDALIAEAVTAVRRQAAAVAATLDTNVRGIAELQIDGARPMPMPRAMMMDAAAAAPVMTEGQTTVAVTVSATVLLAPQ